MKRRITETERLLRQEQPIAWGRAMVVGVIGVIAMMGFVDIFRMMQLTEFSFETFLGGLIRGQAYGQHSWLLGFLANLLVGALFGLFYGYHFEYATHRSGSRTGILLGVWHAVFAAVAVFPFFLTLRTEMGVDLYPNFGFFGFGLGDATPSILLVGHLIYGATVGTLYGPVRVDRVRARYFEPGESGFPGDPGVITEVDDPVDAQAA